MILGCSSSLRTNSLPLLLPSLSWTHAVQPILIGLLQRSEISAASDRSCSRLDPPTLLHRCKPPSLAVLCSGPFACRADGLLGRPPPQLCQSDALPERAASPGHPLPDAGDQHGCPSEPRQRVRRLGMRRVQLPQPARAEPVCVDGLRALRRTPRGDAHRQRCRPRAAARPPRAAPLLLPSNGLRAPVPPRGL